ncbi:hypothetical protein RND81_03G235000 [Saponaria officinalis]|uniref:F-box domain-containing protein n=1 Tax=Saponaria officinalis TaxID=3572 RepID=A0AAW1MAY0_SAPOF
MGDVIEGPSILPQELVAVILCKLPLKSLLRFTTVCKTWLSMIRNDHHFAIKHYLARTTSSSHVLDDVDYMFDLTRATSNRKPCLYSFTAAKTFRYMYKFECVPDMTIDMSNSCHGVICFGLISRCQALLCNPSIQEAVLLPPSPNKGEPALGFDHISNDYKVVTINCENICTVNVYSVRQGYWRNLQVNASFLCNSEIIGYGGSNANGRMCNWLFGKKLESTRTRATGLLSFDMVEEVLKELPMPECRIHKIHEHKLLSSSRWQGCISCLPDLWDDNSKFVDVWVLKGSGTINRSEYWTWNKMFAVKLPGDDPMHSSNFWLNDKEMFVNVGQLDTEEVFHYDLDTQQLRRTGRKGFIFGLNYVGSLVSIKCLMSPKHGSKHGESVQQNVGQDEDSKSDDNGGFIFRVVGRKGVRWSHSLKPI